MWWIRVKDLCSYLNIDSNFDDIMDAQTLIAWEVQDNYFPIDLGILDGFVNQGANPFDFVIPFKGYGINWALWSFHENQTGVAILLMFMPEVIVKYLGVELQDAQLHAKYYWDNYFDESNRAFPALTWPKNIEWSKQTLASLQPPLDGLATVYDLIQRSSGNPFIDTAGSSDELIENLYYWEPGDIETLHTYWLVAKDSIAKLEAYLKWSELTENALRTIEALIELEGKYHEKHA